MKNYNIISESKDGFQSVNKEAVVSFVKDRLSYSIDPVARSDNKFWLNGKWEGGNFYPFIEGERYYQLVVNRFDFGINAKGDFNAFNIAGIIKQEMKEALNA